MQSIPTSTVDQGHRWKRISSLKPYLFDLCITVLVPSAIVMITPEKHPLLLLLGISVAISATLIALSWKVVQKRGNDYRVRSLLYSEIVSVDDVCMTVEVSGRLWKYLAIHLRRPARFGWMVSFVPCGQFYKEQGIARSGNDLQPNSVKAKSFSGE